MEARKSVVKVYPAIDECPHQPNDHERWQESVVLTFQDVDQKVGGFIRLGHYPNRRVSNYLVGVVSPGNCYYRSDVEAPYSDGDRTHDTFSNVGFASARFVDNTSQWEAHDDDLDLSISVVDIQPQFDFWALIGGLGDMQKDFAAEHTEVAGTCTGTIRLGDEHYTISGFVYRDHSWGVRKLAEATTVFANFCWLIGSFGPDLSFGFSRSLMANGSEHRIGYIIENGKPELGEIRDCSFELELDGMTLRSASFALYTPSRGVFEIEVEGFGNTLLELGHEYLENGTSGIARMNGRTGAAHISSMFNARVGSQFPATLIGTSSKPGLYRNPKLARDEARAG